MLSGPSTNWLFCSGGSSSRGGSSSSEPGSIQADQKQTACPADVAAVAVIIIALVELAAAETGMALWGTPPGVAFRWGFSKFQTYAEASWVLQKITGNSGRSA